MIKVPTTKHIALVNTLWLNASYQQKVALLKSLGIRPEWARFKTMREVVEHDGGMVAAALLRLVRLWSKRNPQWESVTFHRGR